MAEDINDIVNEEKAAQAQKKDIDFRSLIRNSEKFQETKKELLVAMKLSLTGITNLVVNYEDPCLVDFFLDECLKKQDLFHNTNKIDAVELQKGTPGQGNSTAYIDQLIYGTFEMETQTIDNVQITVPKIDNQTGKRIRKSDGFVTRKEVLMGTSKDKNLIIKNLDHCLDFCREAGHIDARALCIFDEFRNVSTRKNCRLLLISNVKLDFPFKVRTIELPPVDSYGANHLLESYISLFINHSYEIMIGKSQREQILRKVTGLTYSGAGDVLGYAFSRSKDEDNSQRINGNTVVKVLRDRINKNFMEDGFGLTQLTARPWEDYICPETSNFTYDIKKMLRDFNEIKRLKELQEKSIQNKQDDTKYSELTEALQARIPHVLVLYGKGGVGKSAMPIHLAGLLGFDVWDFNIGAVHSKWVGEGAERMRESLKKIANSSHVIVRIDEYDRAIGATSSSGQGMHESHKQVESEFMNWLQNIQEENSLIKNNIFVVLTTNHKENITGPLLRSGRADLVIDIASFDAKSLKETFITSARRMKNRGAKIIGWDSYEDFQKSIDNLDLERISELSTIKGFTVRDVETLLLEMAAHDYFYRQTGEGIQWNTDNFLKVLEHSQGSTRDSGTGELVLGDRQILMGDIESDNPQLEFSFEENIGFIEG